MPSSNCQVVQLARFAPALLDSNWLTTTPIVLLLQKSSMNPCGILWVPNAQPQPNPGQTSTAQLNSKRREVVHPLERFHLLNCSEQGSRRVRPGHIPVVVASVQHLELPSGVRRIQVRLVLQ